jgi:adenine-specific DNA-methyltransferase
MTQFRDVSIFLNSNLKKSERMNQGIYFTPKNVRQLVFDTLLHYNIQPTHVLEPSFGSGEFIFDVLDTFPNIQTLVGIEKNQNIFDIVSPKFSKHTSCFLRCDDFLNWVSDKKFDLIIGNPPFFTLKNKDYSSLLKEAHFQGRQNIYILFIYKSIQNLLKEDGYLAFIIPTTIYNSSYYQELRNYLFLNTTILYLQKIHKAKFYQTNQDITFILIRKTKPKSNQPNLYFFRGFDSKYYISQHAKQLSEIISNNKTTTLYKLGFRVKTGNVVWNQIQNYMTDVSKNNVMLIHSDNIHETNLRLRKLNGKKKQFVLKEYNKTPLYDNTILVKRGYGNVFHFDFLFYENPSKAPYYVENHLNVIYAKDELTRTKFQMVIKSFHDTRTIEFLKLFVGNGTLSAKSIENLLPIFI